MQKLKIAMHKIVDRARKWFGRGEGRLKEAKPLACP
jgi:hypothetical protein